MKRTVRPPLRGWFDAEYALVPERQLMQVEIVLRERYSGRCRRRSRRPDGRVKISGADAHTGRVRFWTHDRHVFPLPDGHRFPLSKYRLLREAVEREALGEVRHAGPVRWPQLEAVHDPGYLRALRAGTLDRRAQRALGLPWSPELVERARRSVQATIEAGRDALDDGIGMNLGGGTHHAGHDQARGYCVFNDVAVMVATLRGSRALGRVLVVDCDVHQGDGTAELFAADPETFTLSVHGGANYPFRRATSDLDVDLRSGAGDDEYLDALRAALARALRAGRPQLVVFLAGADPWEGDRLGRLALTKAGLAARDELVLDTASEAGAVVCVCLAGGYAPDIRDTVEINLATARLVAASRRRPERPPSPRVQAL